MSTPYPTPHYELGLYDAGATARPARNAGLLSRLARHFRAMPAAYNQRSWWTLTHFLNAPCTTMGCVAGWANVLYHDVNPTDWSTLKMEDLLGPDLSVPRLAQRHLGLTFHEAEVLFHGDFVPAAARDRALKVGEPIDGVQYYEISLDELAYAMADCLEGLAEGAPLLDVTWLHASATTGHYLHVLQRHPLHADDVLHPDTIAELDEIYPADPFPARLPAHYLVVNNDAYNRVGYLYDSPIEWTRHGSLAVDPATADEADEERERLLTDNEEWLP